MARKTVDNVRMGEDYYLESPISKTVVVKLIDDYEAFRFRPKVHYGDNKKSNLIPLKKTFLKVV